MRNALSDSKGSWLRSGMAESAWNSLVRSSVDVAEVDFRTQSNSQAAVSRPGKRFSALTILTLIRV